MKSTFYYDGRRVTIRLEVEDKTERAIAYLLDKLTEASVNVVRGRWASYDADGIEAIEFTMKQPIIKYCTHGIPINDDCEKCRNDFKPSL